MPRVAKSHIEQMPSVSFRVIVQAAPRAGLEAVGLARCSFGKVRDIVGLHMKPAEHALVLCAEEKSQVQALNRAAPCLPVLPTIPARRSHDYVRNGTTSLRPPRHGDREDHLLGAPPAPPPGVLKFLKKIDAEVPADLGVHLVLSSALCSRVAFHSVYTPTRFLYRLEYTDPPPRARTRERRYDPMWSSTVRRACCCWTRSLNLAIGLNRVGRFGAAHRAPDLASTPVRASLRERKRLRPPQARWGRGTCGSLLAGSRGRCLPAPKSALAAVYSPHAARPSGRAPAAMS